MRGSVIVAIIAAFPPTLAALLGCLANSRSIRRSVGAPPGIPLARVIERLEEKIDRLGDGQAAIRERLARIEGAAWRRRPASRATAQGGRSV